MGSPCSRIESFCTCNGSRTARGRKVTRVHATSRVAFRFLRQRRHPEVIPISRLNTVPAHAPVNASPPASRPNTHDSGSPWFATPSVSDSFILYSLSVYPGAPEVWIQMRKSNCYGRPYHQKDIVLHSGLPIKKELAARPIPATGRFASGGDKFASPANLSRACFTLLRSRPKR